MCRFFVFVFDRPTIEVFGWCILSMLFSFLENKAFAGEALVLGEISFLIYLSSVWTSDIFSLLTSNMYSYRGFPWEEAFPIGKPITNHFIFLYYFLNGQPIKYADLYLWEEYPFHVRLVIQSNHNIGACLIMSPSLYHVREYLFSH